MCKISVLIPSYNPGDYVIRCLQSIESQTLDKALFKVYIALNGSDKSFEIYLKEVLGGVSFQYDLFFLEKAGVSNARNFLIDNSAEEFVVFVDDDDVLTSDYLKELLQVSDVTTMGIANVYNFSGSIDSLSENYIGKSFNELDKVTTSKFKARKYFSSPWGKMIHRSIIGNVRFDTKLAIGEDSLFMAQISNRVKAVQKADGSACYYVYEREGSATRRKVHKSKEFKRIIYLLAEYTKMLLSFRYGSLFVMTRIAATLVHGKSLLRC
jgi:glycosyltransferase involved in cell wall biosynthesis